MDKAKERELYNFCYSCIISGDYDGSVMTAEDAVYNINAWSEEDEELAEMFEGVSAEKFTEMFNQVRAELHVK
jgi:hypothetical protein